MLFRKPGLAGILSLSCDPALVLTYLRVAVKHLATLAFVARLRRAEISSPRLRKSATSGLFGLVAREGLALIVVDAQSAAAID